jgi:acetyltransferase-like isoleucine patch superfamily enzyme
MPTAMDTQKELLLTDESKIKKYQRLFVGNFRYWDLIKYELIVVCASGRPGALGLWLRSKLYPRLLKSCGANVVFGANVLLRHPSKISIGKNIVVDDNCVLDAKGEGNSGVSIGDHVFIGRNTLIYCQNGDISIGDGGNIGSNCQIFSARSINVGRNVLIGAYSYLIGGGHNYESTSMAIIQQGRIAKGIHVEDDVWIGAGVMVQDGVTIGKGAIVGAGAVVAGDIPQYTVAAGVPAKIIRNLKEKKSGEK